MVQGAPWFHGDGAPDEEVDIVDVDRPLLLESETARAKRLCELVLSVSDDPTARGGSFYKVLVRLGLPSNGIVRCLGNRLAVLDRRLCEAQKIGFTSASQVDTGALEQVANRLSLDPIAFRECQDGLAFGVEAQAFVLREIFRVVRGSVVSNDRHPPSADRLGQIVGVTLQSPSDIAKAFPVLHRPHRIVDKSSREFESHVFNLQTSAGWYGSIIAVKNCRCVAIPIVEELDETEEPEPDEEPGDEAAE
jgi:hypothetical protein